MPGFVQMIEFKTSRVDELQRLVEEMRATGDTGTARRGTVTQDRERPGYYINIVEFDSYESAMENSSRPEVSEFAAKMALLCDEPPRFYNLDVVESWSAGPTTTTKAAVATAATALAGAAATGITKTRQRIRDRRGGQMPERVAGTSTTTTTAPTVPGQVATDTAERRGQPDYLAGSPTPPPAP